MQGSYFWLRTIWLYMRCINKKIDSHITEIWRAFRRSVPFLNDFWGTDVGWCEGRTFGWVRQEYVHSYQRKDRLSHYQNLTSLSAFGFILKDFFFLETDVGKCEGHTFGWTRLYTWWLQSYQRKDRLSRYQKLTSLSAFGFLLKDFFFFFLETDVGKCEGHTFGWIRHDSIHPM